MRSTTFLLTPLRVALAGLALLATACGGGGGGSTTPPAPPPAPTISTFAATPSTPLVHQAVQLNWVVTSQVPSTLKLTLTPGSTSIYQATGTTTVTPTDSSTTYTLTAEDSNGKTTKTVTVNTVGASVALPSNYMLYDGVRDRLVLSVPSSGGAQGNSVTLVNPASGAIDQSVFVGSEPNRMTLADDGATLWVALEGAAAVRKFDLASRVPGAQFTLGNDGFFGSMYADTFTTLPGLPDTLVVARKYKSVSPRHAGVAVFDAGVQRPTTTPGHTGADVVVGGETASMVYGYNNETTEFGARQITVNASGATVTLTKGSATNGFGLDMVFNSGRLYFTNGDVLLASDFSKVGTYVVPSYSATSVYVDAPGNTVYFCTQSGQVLAFTLNTFTPKASLTLNSSLSFTRVVKVGSNLALTTATRLIIIPVSALN